MVTPSTSLQILAVIPAYNEAQRIQPVLQGVQPHLPILVVDDGSHDQTAAIAEAAGASVIRQHPNQGKGAALRAGFRYAMDNGYSAVLTLDADGQHDPAEIPAFIAAWQSQPTDLLIGARDFHQMPFSRRLANTLGQVIFSWALGCSIRDNQSGYRLISQRLMIALLNSQESGFEFEVEMIARCVQNNWTLAWVPIRTIYSDQGSHIQPIRHIFNFLRVALKTYRQRTSS
jgi:glycosyltransferase involved in cell wall biosynthesis